MASQPDGRRIGAWQLIAPLGRGGMGEVWRAEGPAGPAAIKILAPLAETDDAERRFRREASALNKLRHPNVVRCLDFGRGATGALFLALELLDGESLEERLEKETLLGLQEAVPICAAAADGLAAAHAVGIVHRDVKPGNVFLCRDGSVKVLDFGIALGTSRHHDWQSETRLTAHDVILGTPSYVSPEQITGKRGEDPRADVWGLGAVLYRTLTGRAPFGAGGHLMAEIYRVLNEEPDPIPDDVPAPVRAVVLRALEKAPEDRWPDMATFAAALRETELTTAATEERIERPSPERIQVALDGSPGRAPRALGEEVRLVSTVVCEGLLGDGARTRFEEAVTRFRGRPTLLPPDRGVGVFGGAQWLGDEPERAVRAAIAAAGPGIRMGVGTGKAVLGGSQARRAGPLLGTAMGRAQQALLAAVSGSSQTSNLPPNAESETSSVPTTFAWSIGACPETRRRITGAFRMNGALVISERRGSSAIGVAELGGVEVPMVGRDIELERLVRQVEAGIRGIDAGVTIVMGPAGIGKSRLLHELRLETQRLLSSVNVLEARGEADRAQTSFAAVRAMLRQHAGIAEGSPHKEARRRLEEMVLGSGVERPGEVTPFLGALLEVPFPDSDTLRTALASPEVMAARIRLTVGALVEAWCRAEPVVILLEDLHAVDQASRELLAYLAERLRQGHFVLIATARPELDAEGISVFPGAERLELTELPSSDVASIVERIVGRPEPAIVARAGGVPYFAEELSLAVRDGADPTTLPTTVQGAVQARLDRLTQREKDQVKRAAVLGAFFWTDGLVALGETESAVLMASLRHRELVVPRTISRLAGCDEWAFRHAVVRDVALSMLTAAQRRSLHRMAAAWLGTRPDAPAEELARHHDEAGDFQSARAAWMEATARARRAGDGEKVLLFTARALKTVTGLPLAAETEAAIRLHRVGALLWFGQGEQAREEIDRLGQLIERSEQEGLPLALSQHAEIFRLQAALLARSGDMESAVRAARKAVDVSGESRDLQVQVECLIRLGAVLGQSGRPDEGEGVIRQAEELARAAGDTGLLGRVARALGMTFMVRSRRGEALTYFRRSRDLLSVAGDIPGMLQAATALAAGLANLGDFAEAARVNGEALATATALGLKERVCVLLVNQGLFLVRSGRRGEGLRDLDRAVVLARETDVERFAAGALAYRCFGMLEEGRVEQALVDAERAVEAAPVSDGGISALCEAMHAAALLRAGKPQEALGACERALARRRQGGGMEDLEVELLLTYRDVLDALGRTRDARAALDDAYACVTAALEEIQDPHFRETFSRIGANERVLALMDAAQNEDTMPDRR